MSRLRRVECQGATGPCPVHAWWYEPVHPGPTRKRCRECRAMVRWLALEHYTTCRECGTTMPGMTGKRGRPRVMCLKCSPRKKAKACLAPPSEASNTSVNSDT